MPQPSKSQVHIDKPLTNISTAYIQSASAFVSDKAFPSVPVAKQSDLYFTYNKGDFMRSVAKPRAPGSESAGAGYGMSNASYSCIPIALHKNVPDQLRANADAPIDLDRDATIFLSQQMLLKREIDWAAKYFATSVWNPTDQTGVASGPAANQFVQWNDETSTPVADISERMTEMLNTTSFLPNTLVFGWGVFDALTNHPDILDRIKHTSGPGNPAIATMDALAKVFKVERVLVARSVQNTAAEGATATIASVLGKGALLCYAAPSPGLQVVSAGYTFSWTGLLGAGAVGAAISRFRMDELKSDRIEAEMAYDQKVVAADLGQFFATAIA